jgi:hypothetical protein
MPRSIVMSTSYSVRHPPEKLAVREASPTTAGHGIDTVARERCGKPYRELLVKKNAHQPTA